MAYLIGPKTAEFLRDAMRQGMDLRSRRRQAPRAIGGEGMAPVAPQWRVWHGVESPEPEPGGEPPEPVYTLHCAGGTVWLFSAELEPAESGSSGDRNTTYTLLRTAREVAVAQADLGEAATGAVVLRIAADGSCAIALAADGETPPDGASDVVLANVTVGESGAPAIAQRQTDTVFFSLPSGPEPEPDPDEPPADAPPCGNPINEGGVIENPLDGGGGDDGEGSGGGDEDPDRNPLDHPGDGGYTPYSSGSEDCPETETETETEGNDNGND